MMELSVGRVALQVDGSNEGKTVNREKICKRVIHQFPELKGSGSPRVLCLIDDQDCPEMRAKCGPNTRGFHEPFLGGGLAGFAPRKHWDLILPPAPFGDRRSRPFASVIYLFGSTAATDIQLTLTLAHELQHFVQFSSTRGIWLANVLMQIVEGPWWDASDEPWSYPIEIDARVVAKRVAEAVHGKATIAEYLTGMSQDNSPAAKDFNFVQAIDTSTLYDFTAATKVLVAKHRQELLHALTSAVSDHPLLQEADLS